MAASLIVHLCALALMIAIPLVFTDQIRPEKPYIAIEILVPKPPLPQKTRPPAKIKPAPVAKMTVPKPKVIEPPQPPRITKVRAPELLPPPPVAPPQRPVVPQQPLPAVRPPVQTNVFSGSVAVATVKASPRQVQTGGFGDPHGVTGEPIADRAPNIGRFGSYDLPPGPGYGNGTGGARGIRGTVASAGFGNAVATEVGSDGVPGASHGVVRQAGFGEATAPAETVKARSRPSESPVTPVEILYKPKPAYTAEARNLHLEGEVLLEVLFGAGGNIRVLRVLHGLGHGLDEAARRAAEQIRFKPSMRDGKPVDFTAVVHIVFQLAS